MPVRYAVAACLLWPSVILVSVVCMETAEPVIKQFSPDTGQLADDAGNRKLHCVLLIKFFIIISITKFTRTWQRRKYT